MATVDNYKWIPLVNIDRPAQDGNGLYIGGNMWIGRTREQNCGVVGVCAFPGLPTGVRVVAFHGSKEYGEHTAHYVYHDGNWEQQIDRWTMPPENEFGVGVNGWYINPLTTDTAAIGTLTHSNVSSLAQATVDLIQQANATKDVPYHVTVTAVAVPSNPYEPGGESEDGGGGGDFTLEDDAIPIPRLPSLNITDTHFIRAYKPDLTMLQAFQRWLWQDNPFQSWVNVLGNPYDYIVGLLAIPKTPTTGSAERPVLGNIKAPDSMPKITSQFVRHDFGTVTFHEYSRSYLDYSPYTKVTLYLPYIGYVPLDADYISEKEVNVQYTIDVFTGSFVAYVTVAGKVLYTYNGMMGVHVPITNQTYNNFIGGLIGIAGTIGSMIATEGATAPLGAASIASTATNILKPTVEHGNNLTGTPGVMSVQYPYFIIKRPAQSIPERMQTFTGFPSNTLKSLGDVRGFTKVEYIHIENISATEDEKAEIMSLLKEGVIF